MTHETNLAVPAVVGEIEPDLLADLQSAFPGIGEEYFVWHSGGYPMPRAQGMGSILQPALDIIMAHEQAIGNGSPDVIHFSVDGRDVSPAISQRGDEWHIDGLPAYVVTDNLPTEFMVAETDLVAHRSTAAESLIDRVNQGDDKIEDQDLADAGLRVHRPQPFEVVHVIENVHRSPLNRTTETIPRTWVRIVPV